MDAVERAIEGAMGLGWAVGLLWGAAGAVGAVGAGVVAVVIVELTVSVSAVLFGTFPVVWVSSPVGAISAIVGNGLGRMGRLQEVSPTLRAVWR